MGFIPSKESNQSQTEEERRKEFNKINPFMIPQNNRVSINDKVDEMGNKPFQKKPGQGKPDSTPGIISFFEAFAFCNKVSKEGKLIETFLEPFVV